MRALSTGLLAAQRAATATPYLKVALTKGATSYTFATNDAINRIVSVWHREAPVVAGDDAGDIFRGVPTIQGVPISAVVTIRDYDSEYVDVDLRGYKCVISYGFLVAGSPVSSSSASLKVFSKRNISRRGELDVELYCIDKFAELELQRLIGGYLRLSGTPSGAFTVGETVTGGTSGATAIFKSQGAAYMVVHTIAGSFRVGETVTGGTSLQTLVITATSYEGTADAPPAYTRNVTTLKILGAALSGIAELYNDTDPALATSLFLDYKPLIEDIQNNDTAGRLVRRTLGMTKCVLRARDDFIRIIDLNASWQHKLLGTPSGTFTLGETVTQAGTGATGRFVYQNTDSIIIEAVTGTFDTVGVVTGATSVQTITPTSIEPYDYEYDTKHSFYSCLEGVTVVIPNRVIYVDNLPSSARPFTYSGAAEDATSVASIGKITAMFSDTTIQSDAEAADRAVAKLLHIQTESYQGTIEVPMNCGQEIMDYIRITDGRYALSNVVVGWVGELIRRYEPDTGTYRMELRIGSIRPTAIYPTPSPEAGTKLVLNWHVLFDGSKDTPTDVGWKAEAPIPVTFGGRAVFSEIFQAASGNYIVYVMDNIGVYFYLYDITAQRWYRLADKVSTPDGFAGNALVLRGTKLYVGLGRYRAIGIYDIDTNAWSYSASAANLFGMTDACVLGLCFETDDIIWAVIADYGSVTTGIPAKYTISTNLWVAPAWTGAGSIQGFWGLFYDTGFLYGVTYAMSDYVKWDIVAVSRAQLATGQTSDYGSWRALPNTTGRFWYIRPTTWDTTAKLGYCSILAVTFHDAIFPANPAVFSPGQWAGVIGLSKCIHHASSTKPELYFYDGTGYWRLGTLALGDWSNVVIQKPSTGYKVTAVKTGGNEIYETYGFQSLMLPSGEWKFYCPKEEPYTKIKISYAVWA